MAQRLRFQLSDLSLEEENENLKKLIESYINRSEELEKKESHVIKQVELLQSALTSLQAWNREKESKSFTGPVCINLQEIEDETQKIRKETERIREEVRQKIEENKKLQDEINRRKALETGTVDEFVSDSFLRNMEEETRRQRLRKEEFENERQRIEVEEIETREQSAGQEDLSRDPGIRFFDEKLKKLREMEEKLKKESDEEEKQVQKRRRELKDKIEILEWESQVDRQLLKNLKRKFS